MTWWTGSPDLTPRQREIVRRENEALAELERERQQEEPMGRTRDNVSAALVAEGKPPLEDPEPTYSAETLAEGEPITDEGTAADEDQSEDARVDLRTVDDQSEDLVADAPAKPARKRKTCKTCGVIDHCPNTSQQPGGCVYWVKIPRTQRVATRRDATPPPALDPEPVPQATQAQRAQHIASQAVRVIELRADRARLDAEIDALYDDPSWTAIDALVKALSVGEAVQP